MSLHTNTVYSKNCSIRSRRSDIIKDIAALNGTLGRYKFRDPSGTTKNLFDAIEYSRIIPDDLKFIKAELMYYYKIGDIEEFTKVLAYTKKELRIE